MIILKRQLKQIITEEVVKIVLEDFRDDLQLLSEGVLTEAKFWKRAKDWARRKGIPWATAAAILAGSIAGPKSAIAGPPDRPAQTQVAQVVKDSFLGAFYNAYPEAKDESVNSDIKHQVTQLEREIKGKLALHYLSEQKEESFKRFIQNMDRFKDQSPEQIDAQYEILRPEILKIIQNLSVELVHEGTQTDRMYRSFHPGFRQSGGQVAAAYDEESNKIIINPYEYMSNGQFNMTEIRNALYEEFVHGVDDKLSKTLIPMSKLQTQAAKKMGIFLPKAETGLSQERYDYLTSDHEFYAKMLRLKDLVSENFKDEIDAKGQINIIFLKKLMDGKETLGDPSVIEVLQVLDPNNIKNVWKYFNMVAQAETQKTSTQTA